MSDALYTPIHTPQYPWQVRDMKGIRSAADLPMTIPKGQVRLLLTPNVTASMTQIESFRSAWPYPGKVLMHTWDHLPEHQGIIEDVLKLCAHSALAIWPAWYGAQNLLRPTHGSQSEAQFNTDAACDYLQQQHQHLSLPWIKASIRRCQQAQIPLLSSFPRALQLSQLSLSIDPKDLLLILGIKEEQPTDHSLLSFARAVLWIAKESNARVAIVLSKDLSLHPSLESIQYGALDLFVAPTSPQSGIDQPSQGEHTIWPIQGKPHPFSPGEQALAKRLAGDHELAKLFYFNQTLKTIRDSKYTVDLVWPDGKLVVEIDGYRHHGNSYAFEVDRHRDYELMISGYLVLRLTHNEVERDIELVIEKIRDMVRFRSKTV